MTHVPALATPILRNLVNHELEYHDPNNYSPRLLVTFHCKADDWIGLVASGGRFTSLILRDLIQVKSHFNEAPYDKCKGTNLVLVN